MCIFLSSADWLKVIFFLLVIKLFRKSSEKVITPNETITKNNFIPCLWFFFCRSYLQVLVYWLCELPPDAAAGHAVHVSIEPHGGGRPRSGNGAHLFFHMLGFVVIWKVLLFLLPILTATGEAIDIWEWCFKTYRLKGVFANSGKAS